MLLFSEIIIIKKKQLIKIFQTTNKKGPVIKGLFLFSN